MTSPTKLVPPQQYNSSHQNKKYANKYRKYTSKIGPLKVGSEDEDDLKKMTNLISQQYKSGLHFTKRHTIKTTKKWKQSFRNHNYRRRYERGDR